MRFGKRAAEQRVVWLPVWKEAEWDRDTGSRVDVRERADLSFR